MSFVVFFIIARIRRNVSYFFVKNMKKSKREKAKYGIILDVYKRQDVENMDAEELEEASEVFPLSGGRYLIVEG